MTEPMTELVERRQIPAEIALRRERAEIPQRIAAASARVQNLRGDGAREGDPELEAALRELRELADRQRALPDLIVGAVAERCEIRARQLADEGRELAREAEGLREEAARAQRALEKARRRAAEARSRVEVNEMARDRLRQEARPLAAFARAARETKGEKRLRLLEDAKAAGLLLPFESADSPG
jgi:chromosome segregation ATPase